MAVTAGLNLLSRYSGHLLIFKIAKELLLRKETLFAEARMRKLFLRKGL